MPTIARIGPYRFFFFSNEGREPPHVHVERDAATAKFWLDPVVLSSADGMSSRDLRRLHSIVAERHEEFRSAWDEFFRA
ncbi:MAG: DUF4160 domain-containing protein [bacterium]|nr:DUF4160 domain-containing protein [bacterium]